MAAASNTHPPASSFQLTPREQPAPLGRLDGLLLSRWLILVPPLATGGLMMAVGLEWHWAALGALVIGWVALDSFIRALRDRHLSGPPVRMMAGRDRFEESYGWYLSQEERTEMLLTRAQWLDSTGESFRARAILRTIDRNKLTREQRDVHTLATASANARLGRFDEALTTLGEVDLARLEDQVRWEYLALRAHCRMALGRFEDAAGDVQRIEGDGGPATPPPGLGATRAFIASEQEHEPRRALEASAQAMRMEGTDGQAAAGYAGTATQLVQHAYLSQEAGDDAGALELLERAAPDLGTLGEPDRVLAAYVRARSELGRGNEAAAATALEKTARVATYAWLAPRLEELRKRLPGTPQGGR